MWMPDSSQSFRGVGISQNGRTTDFDFVWNLRGSDEGKRGTGRLTFHSSRPREFAAANENGAPD
jgi:hypothetical protein